MSKTADQIVDIMARLIQSRGYSAVSYQDISEAVGIRKASIHYHFPSKADLGVAVVKQYREALMTVLEGAAADAEASTGDLLERYFEPYLGFKGDDERICLCGALAGELFALPEAMQAEVRSFFEAQQGWLTALFQRGVEQEQLSLPAGPAQTARLYFDALQGALLAKRASGDDSQIDDVVTALRALMA